MRGKITPPITLFSEVLGHLLSFTDITARPIHVYSGQRFGTTLLLWLYNLAVFRLKRVQLFPLLAPLVHLVAIENVGEVEHFENRVSLLSHEFVF